MPTLEDISERRVVVACKAWHHHGCANSRRWRYGGLAHTPACSLTGIRRAPKGVPNFP